MNSLNNIPSRGTFGNIANKINANFNTIQIAIGDVEYATRKNKGMFDDATALNSAIPSPSVGDWALVGYEFPCAIYVCENAGTWIDSEETYDGDNLDLNNYVQTSEYDSFVAATTETIDGIIEVNEQQPNLDYCENDFDIRDESGHIIVGFKNGHVFTKEFNSESVGNFIEGDSESDFDIRDENDNILMQLANGHIKTKNFDSRGMSNTYTIYCIGDSTTQGQEGIDNPVSDTTNDENTNCYPNILNGLIGGKHVVKNLGVGGQKTGEALVRCGMLDAIVKTAFTLKGDGTKTILCSGAQTTNGASGVIVDSVAGEPVNYQMQQGTSEAREQMSTCYVNNTKCALSYVNPNLQINRIETASSDLEIGVGTHIMLNGYNQVENGIFLFKLGENDVISTYSNASFNVDNYIAKIKTAVRNLGTDKWLVMGEVNGNTANMEKKNEMNQKLATEFGSHFVDLAGFITSRQAFLEIGVTPTTDSNISSARQTAGVVSDESCMTQGITPSSFWRYSYTPNHLSVDKIHMNYNGYYIVAKLFYDKMKQFNWI